MRTLPLLLGLSLVANLGLAYAWLARPAGSPDDGPAPAPHHATAAVAPAATTSADALSPEAAQALPGLFRQLTEGDFSTEVARLRTLGLPEETVNMIAQVMMMQKFKKAFAALGEDGMSPLMWGGNHAKTDAQRELQRKMRQLQKDLGEEAREAGIDWGSLFSPRSKVPGISEDKARLIARIEQDRQELRSQIYMDASGMMLERDQAQLKFIDEEYKKDLAATLSPEELEAWNLRRSETAQGLRAQLAYMSPSEEEFSQIYQLQATFNETWPNQGGNTDWQKRSEAEGAMRKQIAEVLGPERYTEYQKATDNEFGTLSNLEYRLELPKGTADRVYGLHKETDQAAAKIRSDKSLSDADRKESLKVLAEQVKTDITSTLGEEGFKAYKNQNGHWIDSLTR